MDFLVEPTQLITTSDYNGNVSGCTVDIECVDIDIGCVDISYPINR